jgi:hypothetical protein
MSEIPQSDPERTIRIANALVEASERTHLDYLAFNMFVQTDMAARYPTRDYLNAAQATQDIYEKELNRLNGPKPTEPETPRLTRKQRRAIKGDEYLP